VNDLIEVFSPGWPLKVEKNESGGAWPSRSDWVRAPDLK
jgi:hypothetical protein